MEFVDRIEEQSKLKRLLSKKEPGFAIFVREICYHKYEKYYDKQYVADFRAALRRLTLFFHQWLEFYISKILRAIFLKSKIIGTFAQVMRIVSHRKLKEFYESPGRGARKLLSNIGTRLWRMRSGKASET